MSNDKVIEWIPYDRLQDIKQIAKSTIYYVKWLMNTFMIGLSKINSGKEGIKLSLL